MQCYEVDDRLRSGITFEYPYLYLGAWNDAHEGIVSDEALLEAHEEPCARIPLSAETRTWLHQELSRASESADWLQQGAIVHGTVGRLTRGELIQGPDGPELRHGTRDGKALVLVRTKPGTGGEVTFRSNSRVKVIFSLDDTSCTHHDGACVERLFVMAPGGLLWILRSGELPEDALTTLIFGWDGGWMSELHRTVPPARRLVGQRQLKGGIFDPAERTTTTTTTTTTPAAPGVINELAPAPEAPVESELEPTARLVLQRPGLADRAIPLQDANTIGRQPGNTIHLPDRSVSKEHCTLERRNGGFVLRDLGSTNGTFINGIPITGEVPLRHNDELQFGLMTRARFEDLTSAETPAVEPVVAAVVEAVEVVEEPAPPPPPPPPMEPPAAEAEPPVKVDALPDLPGSYTVDIHGVACVIWPAKSGSGFEGADLKSKRQRKAGIRTGLLDTEQEVLAALELEVLEVLTA